MRYLLVVDAAFAKLYRNLLLKNDFKCTILADFYNHQLEGIRTNIYDGNFHLSLPEIFSNFTESAQISWQ